MKKQNSNKIKIIIAKKGSGKTTLATALSLIQNKKVFFISPLEKSFFHFISDTSNLDTCDYNDLLEAVNLHCNDMEMLEYFINTIQDNTRNKGALIIIDELDKFTLGYKKDIIYNLVNYGRHSKTDIIVISRRLQDIPKNFLTNSDYLYFGVNHNLAYDSKNYKDLISDELVELVKKLKIGEFLQLNLLNNKLNYVYIDNEAKEMLYQKSIY